MTYDVDTHMWFHDTSFIVSMGIVCFGFLYIILGSWLFISRSVLDCLVREQGLDLRYASDSTA